MNIPEEIQKIASFSNVELQKYFRTQPLKKLHAIKLYVDDLYHNTGKPTGLTDWQYDKLSETLKRRDPDYIVPIGAKIREGENRAKLPYWLGSMNKMSLEPEFQDMDLAELRSMLKEAQSNASKLQEKGPDNEEELNDAQAEIDKIQEGISGLRFIQKWTQDNKGPYEIEYKLDGVSCLLVFKKGKMKLYTRGDGVLGADISYFAQHLDTIPKNLSEDISVRGELIMPVETFERKYSKKYANARNLVAGVLGAKTIKESLRDIQFVAYEIVGDSRNEMPRPSEQFETLDSLGFAVVNHERVNTISVKYLAKLLVSWKEASPFMIDGLIIQGDHPYFRNRKGNPSYAFAFKMRTGDNIVDAKVVKVHWGLSKWGQLKPRVEIEPVQLVGTTVTYASGKNGKFINTNNIGPGAIVKVTKAGEVIPDIIGIVKRASEPDMPSLPCEWKWNKTKVDIIGIRNCGEVCPRLIHSFLQKMDFKGLGLSRVQKLYQGGIDSLLLILTIDNQKLREAGFGAGETKNILASITSTLSKGMSLSKMLGASGVLGQGVGSKKAALLLNTFPNILVEQKQLSYDDLLRKVSRIEGYGHLTAQSVAKNLRWAALFTEMMGYLTTFTSERKADGPLKGYTVIITGTLPGYGRKEAEAAIEAAGGQFSKSVKKPKEGLNQILVVADKPGKNKIEAADKYMIKKYSAEEFIKILKDGSPPS